MVIVCAIDIFEGLHVFMCALSTEYQWITKVKLLMHV